MKHLFYLFLVINLLFLLLIFGSQSETVEPPPIDHSEDSSSLLELDNTPEDWSDHEDFALQSRSSEDHPATPRDDSPPPSPAMQSVELSPDGCYELGPVRSREATDEFVSLLGKSAKKPNITTRSGAMTDGWWVIYPRARNREEAEVNRRLLESKGVVDTWLFTRGPLRGTLSTGLYPTREEADEAAEKLKEKGIKIQVRARLIRSDVFWIRFSWDGLPLELEEIVRVLNSQDESLQMPMPIPCRK